MPWEILLHTVKICRCDQFSKQADWPIAELDKIRWEGKTENEMKGGVQRSQQPEEHTKWDRGKDVSLEAVH